jgi:hypothetical protein
MEDTNQSKCGINNNNNSKRYRSHRNTRVSNKKSSQKGVISYR